MKLFPYQVSSSVILAAALRDLFPDAQVLAFQATEKCFYCDILFPFKFESEMIPLLEERMKAWVKKDLPFQQLEMMPANAAQFLRHNGNPALAEVVRHQPGTVLLIQLDNFAGRSPGETLETTGELEFFKLIPPQIHGKRIRLIGTAAHSKDELKDRVKACKELKDHLKLIEEKKLLMTSSHGWIWLPKGEEVKKNLIEKAVQLFSGIDRITTPARNEKELVECHTAYGKGSFEVVKLDLGGDNGELFDPKVGLADRAFLPLEEKSVTFFLQIATKFLKIFAFDYEVVIVGKTAKILREALKKESIEAISERGEQPGIEFVIADDLGRLWTGSRISIEGNMVQMSLFHSLERFVAFLVEKGQL